MLWLPNPSWLTFWGLLVDNEAAATGDDINAMLMRWNTPITAKETAQPIFDVCRQDGARVVIADDERVLVAPCQPRWLAIDVAVRAVANLKGFSHVHHEHRRVSLVSSRRRLSPRGC